MDPFNVGPRSHVSSPWPHLILGHKFMNLFPKGERHPSLCKLSYLIYYLTQLFHLLWNFISPCCLPEAKLLTPVLLWEGASHTQFCTEKSHGTVGSSWFWAEPSETSPPRNSQSLRSTWRVSLLVSGWFLPPSQNPGAYMLYVISTWCLKFCLLVVLNQLQNPGHCPIQFW